MGIHKATHVRGEIHGLRAIAVLMVVVYHVWLGRVSGGVDVFLFLTGFLITGTLLRAAASKGRPFGGAFFSRLASRLLPPVVVVIVGTLVATYLFMPRHRWTGTFQESLASLLYVENWVLAGNSVDYLAQDNPPSLLQHFWSLSMQGQFYPLWFAVVLGAALIARHFGWSIKRIVFVGASLVFVLSFGYSLWRTATDQPWAYFDTGARLWQFAVGALLFLVIDRITLSLRARIVLGWAGLIALVSLGALIDVSRLFPGWVALVPMAAAAAILVAGETRSKSSVDYMLAWGPITKLSDWSYALYLWHWPVLLVYLQVRGYDEVGLRGGAGIIVVSVVLAALTTEALKRRPWRLPKAAVNPSRRLRYAALWVVPAFVITGVGGFTLARDDARATELAQGLAQDATVYPGALTVVDSDLFPTPADTEFIPALETLPDRSLTLEVDEKCHAGLTDSTLYQCAFGDVESDIVVAVVGASRIDHYLWAFDAAGSAHGWRVESMIKSGCQFSTSEDDIGSGDHAASCVEWNTEVYDVLMADPPDLVLLLGTRNYHDRPERLLPGVAERFDQLDAAGMRIMAIRDIPRRPEKLAECVAQNGSDACAFPVQSERQTVDPTGYYPDAPDSLVWFDFLPYVCPEGSCPAIIGNVLTYYDSSHLTGTFARSLAPVAAEAVKQGLGLDDE